ncbi:MAG TPA: hypothetical protein ENN90_14995, partial [Mariniphaga anaerophila]|nr:hypothetical protein [Mariniphaga anaerophila]
MNKQKTLFLSFLLFGLLHSVFAAPSDFDVIKKRVLQTLMESSVNDETVQSLVNTIQENGTWPDINYEDVS